MKIFVAGGTGFVGSHLISELFESGHDVTLLVRNPEKTSLPEGVKTVKGDALEPVGWKEKLARFEAVINLIGIIREFPSRGITYRRLHFEATRNLCDAARESGVRRWLQMSANGARPDGVSEYQRSKYEAEEYLKCSGFDLTIFRPSLIFGPPPKGKTEFCAQMAGILKRSPVVPLFGDGRYRFQPIHVGDVARVFELALENPESIGKTFHLGGDKTFSYRELLDIICDASGISPRIKIPIPYSLIRPLIALLGKFPFFPATVDQTDMLVEGNTVPETLFKETFGIKPLDFSPANLPHLGRD